MNILHDLEMQMFLMAYIDDNESLNIDIVLFCFLLVIYTLVLVK